VSPGQAAGALVRALLKSTDLLYGVGETADVVVADAVARSASGAGALLIRDGERWRVAAGAHLRNLEHRCELAADSWLVEHVARGQQGVVISDTDAARSALQGAPLASWRHVLAVPVPHVDGVLMLARNDDPPFDTDDLEALAVLADEAAPLLKSAVETRALARVLKEFRDESGSAR
jgi:GAF domain